MKYVVVTNKIVVANEVVATNEVVVINEVVVANEVVIINKVVVTNEVVVPTTPPEKLMSSLTKLWVCCHTLTPFATGLFTMLGTLQE